MLLKRCSWGGISSPILLLKDLHRRERCPASVFSSRPALLGEIGTARRH
ncbi:hypothetical protein SLEP1_g56716 [Rubroshorea leprosula]|uniref:Uncharacterized protein n=1 Tax=Rubroshorea leprosula TaxID=152421 RepID=A0AAV5MMA8_9ROSI|nr:hypothetical protein SLEP1_g56716 [Rubroshorea leprosula]